MPKPTEKAIKRKPMAVVMLTTERSSLTDDGLNVVVPAQGYDFEWFETEKGREKFFDQVTDFNVEDAKAHDDFAYITAVVTDTATMTLGRVEAAPSNPKMTKWKNAIKKDPSLLIAPVVKAAEKKAVVKAPRKATPKKATAVKGAPTPKATRAKPTVRKGADAKAETPTVKAAGLRKKLAAKKGTTQAEAEVEALNQALKG